LKNVNQTVSAREKAGSCSPSFRFSPKKPSSILPVSKQTASSPTFHAHPYNRLELCCLCVVCRTGMSNWWLIPYMVPLVNLPVMAYNRYEISKRFGYSWDMALLLCLPGVSWVGWLLLTQSKRRYLSESNEEALKTPRAQLSVFEQMGQLSIRAKSHSSEIAHP
jgi:hypothetical protein